MVRMWHVAVGGLLLALTSAQLALAQPTPDEVATLGRLGYGHDPYTRGRLKALGLAGYLDEQLDPARLPDPFQRDLDADPAFAAWGLTLQELEAKLQDDTLKPGGVLLQVKNEMLWRAIASRRQVEALLTEFWFNHFNVDNAGFSTGYLIPYVRDAIRPRVLGKFEDLLLAVARSPAMLIYLNNDENYKEGFTLGSKVRGINENYARELMELHTLGCDDQAGVYTQQDVIALAKCLTGWSQRRGTGYVFVAGGHDQTRKTVIKLDVPANGGEKDGELAIAYLANHPRTARFITQKLTSFLAGPGNGPLAAEAMAVFMSTKGDLAKVVRKILASPALLQSAGNRIKRPSLLLASAVRSVGGELGAASADRWQELMGLSAACEAMGQALFEVPPPTGNSDTPTTFLDEGTTLERFRVVHQLFAGGDPYPWRFDPGNKTGPALVTALCDQVLGKDAVTAKTRAALEAYIAGKPASTPEQVERLTLGLLLCSPEFAKH